MTLSPNDPAAESVPPTSDPRGGGEVAFGAPGETASTPLPHGAGPGPPVHDGTLGSQMLSRTDRVAAATQSWRRHLAGLGGPNPLLWYRDQPLGTLDLSTAHPGGVSMLMAGRATRLSDLVREPSALAEARRRAHAIHAKTVEMYEERGLRVGYMAIGMAAWTLPGSAQARAQAPVLLRSCTLRPIGVTAQDYDLDLGTAIEFNPVLHDYLTSSAHIHLDGAALTELVRSARRFDPVPVFRELNRHCGRLPGFRIADRKVVSTFPYAKSAAVHDLSKDPEQLSTHDVIAVLAGDPQAHRAVGPPDPPETPEVPGRELGVEDRVVLDADGAQLDVIDAVLSGADTLVQAPPGTGATQTIANVIALLAEEGKRVLFVAEKRAAIDAVRHRLARVSLAHVLLDVHEGLDERSRMLHDVLTVLDRAPRPHRATNTLVESLAENRSLLQEHRDELHRTQQPWGVSVFEAQQALAGLARSGTAPAASTRLRGGKLARTSRQDVTRLGSLLELTVRAGAWETRATDPDPWFGAQVTTPEEVARAGRIVDQLAWQGLARLRGDLDRYLAKAGLPPAEIPSDWGRRLDLLQDVRRTLAQLEPQVFTRPLDRLLAATGGRPDREAYRQQHGEPLRWWTRWSLRREARTLVRQGIPVADLHAALVGAQRQREDWTRLAGQSSSPRVPDGLDGATDSWVGLSTDLTWLTDRLPPGPEPVALLDTPMAHLAERLVALAAHPDRLRVLPGVVPLLARLTEAGLEDLVRELAEHHHPVEQVARELEFVWWASILEEFEATSPGYGAHNGTSLRSVMAEYVRLDQAVIHLSGERVQTTVRDRLARVRGAHPQQEGRLRAAASDSLAPSLAGLIDKAPDLLTAAKPCWAMSPLVVAAQVPPGHRFDVVIFDEASQISVAQAISAISRAGQVVVVGDNQQLPPLPYTAVSPEREETPPADDVVPVSGEESVLSALSGALPPRAFECDYRSTDERLMSFSNRHFYGGRLVTFPTADGHSPVRLVTMHTSVGTELDSDPARPSDTGPQSSGRSAPEGPSAAPTTDAAGVSDGLAAATETEVTSQGAGQLALETSGSEPTEAPAEPLSLTDSAVSQVVWLVIDHASRRPGESLAVVTLGPRHALRIEEGLRRALAGYPDRNVVTFFDEARAERFVVKSVDRFQGDERDAIIFAVAHPRAMDAHSGHPFGALSLDGGEQRLNVAITRARRRLTVVSAVTATELVRQQVPGPGIRLLGEFLSYVQSGGGDQHGSPTRPGPVVETSPQDTSTNAAIHDPLLDELASRLRQEGLVVHEAYGTSSRPIELAVEDPHAPGHLIVAVETDGADYAAVERVRDRERIRPDHLRRLGWKYMRVWRTDIFRDPTRDVGRILDAIRAADTRSAWSRSGREAQT